jgi:DNA modification methylase
MVFTDPPYNVRINGHVSARGRHREFPMASGEMSPYEFSAFLERSFRLMTDASCDGAIHFVCMDWRHLGELLVAAAPIYGEPKQLCIWVKDNAGMGSFYRSQHEVVYVFKVGTAPHVNNFGLGERGRYRTNVWRYPGTNSLGPNRAATLAMHPTVKPVALVVDAIKDCSQRGGIVLDPYGGSGTTLISAERTGRQARLIEFDPHYVDLIIRRWQSFTGAVAVHIGSNRTFDEISRSQEHTL